jgi:hypothetical protein
MRLCIRNIKERKKEKEKDRKLEILHSSSPSSVA